MASDQHCYSILTELSKAIRNKHQADEAYQTGPKTHSWSISKTSKQEITSTFPFYFTPQVILIDVSSTLQQREAKARCSRNIWDPRPRPGFISYHSGQVAACPQAIHWCCWIVKTWFNMLTGYELINLIASGYCIRSEALTALTALAITDNIYNQMLLNWKISGLLTTHSCCSHYSCLFNFI